MRLLAFFTLTVCLGFSCFSESQEKPLIEEKDTIKAAAVQASKKNQNKKQFKINVLASTSVEIIYLKVYSIIKNAAEWPKPMQF